MLISNSYVASNTPIGETVATLMCDDDDSEDLHTFRFVYTVSQFAIVGNQVQVSDRHRYWIDIPFNFFFFLALQVKWSPL